MVGGDSRPRGRHRLIGGGTTSYGIVVPSVTTEWRADICLEEVVAAGCDGPQRGTFPQCIRQTDPAVAVSATSWDVLTDVTGVQGTTVTATVLVTAMRSS